MTGVLRKYRLLLLPLVLVLTLDISLLAMNYRIGAQLDVSATNINIAGRQRMLSQRITKAISLFYFDTHHGVLNANKDELIKSAKLFDQTLKSFIDGGLAISASGKEIRVTKLLDTQAISILHDAKTLWEPLRQQLNVFTTTNKATEEQLSLLVNSLAESNVQLLKLMNDLTNNLENEAREKTIFLRVLQSVVVVFILLLFLVATIRLYNREKYYNGLMEKSTDLIISTNVKTALVTFVSSSVEDFMGYDEQHYMGKPASLFFTKESKAEFAEILETVYSAGKLKEDRCEVQLLRRDGTVVVSDMVMQITTSEDGRTKEVSADIRDISERKQMEVALKELAHKDILTGLPNRSLFYELAEHSISLAKRHKTMLAILFLDLDGFKLVNDTYGHEIGDTVLIEVTKRITSILRASDSVSRIGGDEFVILLEDIGDTEQALRLSKEIIDSVSQTIEVDSRQQCHVGASIGIALYPKNGDSVETLLHRADTAMYDIKNSGKNSAAFYVE